MCRGAALAAALAVAPNATHAGDPPADSPPLFDVPPGWIEGQGIPWNAYARGELPLPDGGRAALVRSLHGWSDPGPHARALLDQWIIYLDRDDVPIGRFRLPKMKSDRPIPMLALGDRSILFGQNFKNYVCLARVSRKGSLLWENCASSRMVSDLPAVARVGRTGFVFADYDEIKGTDEANPCRIARVDGRGRIVSTRTVGDRLECWFPTLIELAGGDSLFIANVVVPGKQHEMPPKGKGTWTFQLIARLDGAGRVRFEREIDTFFDDFDVDSDGSVAALSNAYDTTPGGPNWAVFRLDPEGREVWRRNGRGFADPEMLRSSAEGIWMLPDGEVLIVLRRMIETENDSRSDGIFAARLDASGSLVWARDVDGPRSPEGSSIKVEGVAVLANRQLRFRMSRPGPEDDLPPLEYTRTLPVD